VFSAESNVEEEAKADTAKTGLSGSALLGPSPFLRIGFSKDGDERRVGIGGSNYHVNSRGEREQCREITVPRVSVTETPWTAAGEVTEPDVREADPRERVKDVQLLESREIAFDDPMGQRAMLSPLDVDRDLAAIAPIGVEQSAVPEGPDIRRCPGRVVTDPKDLFVGRDGEGNPGTVDIIEPEQVVGDDWAGRIDDRDDPFEREPLVALDV